MKKNIAAFAVIGAIVVPTLAHSEEHCRIFDGGLQSPKQRAATVSPHRQPSLLSSPLPAAVHQPAHYREIPIAFAAPPCLTSRGFLPWRLSEAGPGACRAVAMGRHPKPFSEAGVRRPAEHVSSTSDS